METLKNSFATKPLALISVSDKKGVRDFAQGLIQLGWDIVATEKTFAHLEEAGIGSMCLGNLFPICNLTDMPESMDGRFRTYHERIYGGIVFDRKNQTHVDYVKKHNMRPIDMVVVNLPDPPASEETAIDIGGGNLIRAAASNYEFVSTIVSPEDYEETLYYLNTVGLTTFLRRILAFKAFRMIAKYDCAIENYLRSQIGI